jgi:hypothetical protein
MALEPNQVLTLAVANLPTFTLVLLWILYNNARLNDLRDLFRAELRADITGVRSELGRDMGGLRSEFHDLRNTMEKYHNDILRILADHDQRINRLEDQK